MVDDQAQDDVAVIECPRDVTLKQRRDSAGICRVRNGYAMLARSVRGVLPYIWR